MNLFNKITILFVFMSFFSGCKKFVQVDPPITQLVTSSVFNDVNAATAAQTAIYTKMGTNAESYLMSSSNGLLADELTNYALANVSQQALYQNAMTSALTVSTGPFGCWINAYTYIYQANDVIAGLQNNKYVSAAAANQLTGEAKFIRAFWYFYLTNEYGDVPLITSTNYNINMGLARTGRTQVYAQVVADLSDAGRLLNSNYVDVTDTTITSDRVRPNQGAAAALLARVYLYAGKYDSAEKMATSVINNQLYSLITPLNPANYSFTVDNAEAIWQLYTPTPFQFNGATSDGYYYVLVSAPPTNVALSMALVNSFEPGDLRRTVFVDSIIGPGNSIFYFSNKYQVGSQNATGSATEYETVFRLAEQYLIRAEARAQQNNLIGSARDLDVIRVRAGLDSITTSVASSQSSLLTAILHERQVELFTEWGHRWFDLVRTGSADSVMGSPGNACQNKGGVWQSTDVLFPIPQQERVLDPNLSQNGGY